MKAAAAAAIESVCMQTCPNRLGSCPLQETVCIVHTSGREDEFDATYCYGSGSTNQDIHDRTILPLVCKLIEGYNVCVLLMGATGVNTAALCTAATPGGSSSGLGAGVTSYPCSMQ